ncbi:MAG TPA: galactosyltransferase-related protein [Natronosporangium sp.]
MWAPQVTVVLPVFGSHLAAQALPAVSRAWLRQDLPCEVVVAATRGTTIPPLGDDPRVRTIPADSTMNAAGRLRNLAAAAARGRWLYLGDADIAPVGDDYLSRAVALASDGVVMQPWLYRLVNAGELLDVDRFESPGRGRICHVIGDAAGRLTPIGKERFQWLGDGMMVVEPPPGYGWPGEDGRPWRPPPFHWGGFLLERAVFEAIGGYHAGYAGWGCEDDDLIAKLVGSTNVIRAWRVARQLTCVHFEHSRDHTWRDHAANKPKLHQRLAAGVEAMIKEDR